MTRVPDNPLPGFRVKVNNQCRTFPRDHNTRYWATGTLRSHFSTEVLRNSKKSNRVLLCLWPDAETKWLRYKRGKVLRDIQTSSCPRTDKRNRLWKERLNQNGFPTVVNRGPSNHTKRYETIKKNLSTSVRVKDRLRGKRRKARSFVLERFRSHFLFRSPHTDRGRVRPHSPTSFLSSQLLPQK